MNLKRKCQVVMLPTNEKANPQIGSILINSEQKLVLFDEQFYKIWKAHQEFGNFEPNSDYHYIYILSDEEIKKGDWFLQIDRLDLGVLKADINFGYDPNDVAKKIIATTDKLSTEPYQGHYNGIDCTDYLPQPSQQFINKFIEEWNKGNKIEWVNVEYEEYFEEDTSKPYTKDGGQPAIKIQQLKVDKNNYITITKIKNTFDLVDLRKAFRAGMEREAALRRGMPDLAPPEDKWIEEYTQP